MWLPQSAQIGIAAAELYPQLSLTGTFTLDAGTLSRTMLADSLFYSAGPAVRWNVLNFGRVRGNIAAQESRFDQAVARYRETVIAAAAEVDSAISTFVCRQEQQQRLEAAVESARESIRVALNRYLEGAVGFQSLLDAQRVLVQVQDQHVAARGSAAVAAVALYKALGGGWESADGLIVMPAEATSPEFLLRAEPGQGDGSPSVTEHDGSSSMTVRGAENGPPPLAHLWRRNASARIRALDGTSSGTAGDRLMPVVSLDLANRSGSGQVGGARVSGS